MGKAVQREELGHYWKCVVGYPKEVLRGILSHDTSAPLPLPLRSHISLSVEWRAVGSPRIRRRGPWQNPEWHRFILHSRCLLDVVFGI